MISKVIDIPMKMRYSEKVTSQICPRGMQQIHKVKHKYVIQTGPYRTKFRLSYLHELATSELADWNLAPSKL